MKRMACHESPTNAKQHQRYVVQFPCRLCPKSNLQAGYQELNITLGEMRTTRFEKVERFNSEIRWRSIGG